MAGVSKDLDEAGPSNLNQAQEDDEVITPPSSGSSFSTFSDHPPPLGLPRYTRHNRFYFCNLVVLVENVLFCVPKAALEHSEAFGDMFSVPPPADADVDGVDDEHPLHLEGYLADDFEQLLRVLIVIPPDSPDNLSWRQWVSVLKLSTIWGFHAIRDNAIARLSSLHVEPIEKIILAKQYRVAQWLVPELNILARRSQALSFDEAARIASVLGWAFIMKLVEVRESNSGSRLPGMCLCSNTYSMNPSPSFSCHNHGLSFSYSPLTRENYDFTSAIKKSFGGDIDVDAYDASQTVAEPSDPVVHRSSINKKKKGKSSLLRSS